jgi:hypothetical protein
MVNILWWLMAVAGIFGGIDRNYSDKPLLLWSWQRKLYFSCWSVFVLICAVNGFRIFIEDTSFNFWAQLAGGISTMSLAIVPCGMDVLNKPWPVRRLRDLVFIALGAGHIYIAFLEYS